MPVQGISSKVGMLLCILTYISLLLNPVIPVVMLFVMNIIVIRAVGKSQRIRILNENQMGWDQNKSSEIQLTIMLLLVSTVFVVLLLPFEIWAIYYSIFSKSKTPEQYAKFVFMFDVTYELYNVNYGINFYIYFASGTKFRRDLLTLFHIKSLACCRTKANSTAVENISKSVPVRS